MDKTLFVIQPGDTEAFAKRTNEAPLAILLPAVAYIIAYTDYEDKLKLLELMCSMLVRWEELTGAAHELDAVYNELSYKVNAYSSTAVVD